MAPSAHPPSDPIALEALEALAAGDLPAAEADALQRRIDADPALQARYREAQRLEAALGGEALLPIPPGLTAQIVAGLPTRGRRRDLRPLARLAAAVLLAFGTWAGTSVAWPSLATAAPAPGVEDSIAPALVVFAEPAVAAAEALPAGVPDVGSAAGWPLIVGGLALLAVGLWLARILTRNRGAPARRESTS